MIRSQSDHPPQSSSSLSPRVTFEQLTGLTCSPGSESAGLSCVYMERTSSRSTVLERFRKEAYVSRMRSWSSGRTEPGGGRCSLSRTKCFQAIRTSLRATLNSPPRCHSTQRENSESSSGSGGGHNYQRAWNQSDPFCIVRKNKKNKQ